ncbi:uncharacterized protein [Choristoneura fumiferana]|uniref:uncharacterized protein n=1 Tax=Choristoneura fumiferana TaxID=7141 RepID=UPI003D15E1D6
MDGSQRFPTVRRICYFKRAVHVGSRSPQQSPKWRRQRHHRVPSHCSKLNETSVTGVCDDSIDVLTFFVNSIASISCAIIALVASGTLKLIGKKALLMLVYFILGAFCIAINYIKTSMVFAVLLSALQIVAVAIGPINAYAVEIFPTHLRGMAVSLALMLGRLGSVLGTNVAGLLINASCETTFYLFGGLLLLCGLMAILLPKAKSKLCCF